MSDRSELPIANKASATAALLSSLAAPRPNRRRRNPGLSGGQTAQTAEGVVQNTDNDAAKARLSAVLAGYLSDPFAAQLSVCPAADSLPRLPITNRGTYVRTTVIDRLVNTFISATGAGQTVQIVSLGAGSDSRYFRIVAARPDADVVYHELDFGTNTSTKVTRLRSEAGPCLDVLQEHLRASGPITDHNLPTEVEADQHEDGIVWTENSIRSSRYNLHPIDLRTLVDQSDTVGISGLLPRAPTLVISECCLCYLDPAIATKVVEKVVDRLISRESVAGLVLYEPIRPFDRFGQQMRANLASRRISFPTVDVYPSLAAEKSRLTTAGLGDVVGAADVLHLWNDWIEPEERERIGGLEMVDELEEWELLAAHYCVAWGLRCQPTSPFGAAWAQLGSQMSDR